MTIHDFFFKPPPKIFQIHQTNKLTLEKIVQITYTKQKIPDEFNLFCSQVSGWHLMNMVDAIKADRDLVLLSARPWVFSHVKVMGETSPWKLKLHLETWKFAEIISGQPDFFSACLIDVFLDFRKMSKIIC